MIQLIAQCICCQLSFSHLLKIWIVQCRALISLLLSIMFTAHSVCCTNVGLFCLAMAGKNDQRFRE